jgi:prepilin-type N-terminal cleavage/methylation domain-containing protein
MRGFSLIEVLCVMGMVSILASLTAYAGIGAIQQQQIAEDALLVAAALRTARAAAMHAECVSACPEPSTAIQLDTLTVFMRGTDFSLPLYGPAAPEQDVYFDRKGMPGEATVIKPWGIEVHADGVIE